MAYRFRKKDKSAGHAARRIAREQVDKAIAAIDAADPSSDAIGQVRERCRRVVSVVELLGELHSTGREEARAFTRISEELAGPGNVLALAEIRRSIESELSKRHTSGADAEAEIHNGAITAQLGRIRRRLVKARKRIESWQIAGTPIPQLWQQVQEARAHIAEDFPDFGADLHGQDLHRFRKRIRTYWHHLRLFRALGGPEVSEQEKTTRQLVNLIGRLRDIEQFEQRLAQSPDATTDPKTAQQFAVFCRRETTVLRGKIGRLARSVLNGRQDTLPKRARR